MLTSLFFVVAGFIEFAVVLQLHQYNKKCMIKKKSARKWKRKMHILSQKENAITIKPIFNIYKIDRVAFAVGGLSFILFNVMYWFTFLIFNFN